MIRQRRLCTQYGSILTAVLITFLFDGPQSFAQAEGTPGLEVPTIFEIGGELGRIPPSMPMSQLLGRTRANIETLFYPPRPGLHGNGWISYANSIEVRYDTQEIAVAMRLYRPVELQSLTCAETAVWYGFGVEHAPNMLDADACFWSQGSLVTSSGAQVAARLDSDVFDAWLPAADSLEARVVVTGPLLPVGYGHTYEAQLEEVLAGPALTPTDVTLYTMDLGSQLFEAFVVDSPYTTGESLIMTFQRAHEPPAALVGFRDSERNNWQLLSIRRAE